MSRRAHKKNLKIDKRTIGAIEQISVIIKSNKKREILSKISKKTKLFKKKRFMSFEA